MVILIHAIMFHYGLASASWKGDKVDDGFIKLHRSILDWEWYESANTKIVFLHLLLKANWEDSRFQGYKVPKGSLVTSYKSLSDNLGISIKAVRVALEHLKSTGEVTIKRHSHFSIISLTNWEKYQGYKDEEGKHWGNQTALKGQSKGNIKEIKNIRNKEYYKKSESKSYEPDYDFDAMEREYGLK